MVLLKKYKKHRIEKTKDGIIEVVSPNNSRFIVALDDSKVHGRRKFINKANNVTSAKKYIDWITK